MMCREIAREDETDLVGENFLGFVIDNAAAVAITVEPDR
jgi:hypothetical protein